MGEGRLQWALRGTGQRGRVIKPKKARRAAQLPLLPTDLADSTSAEHPHDFSITWQCPNCGQIVFGRQPPEVCDYCRDLTTWRRVVDAGVRD
ncbi:MAG: hypothetical protein JNM70_03675 [Anaerolineae bacterium]|nr:hypothetical protein [Anaerolineae bacterium]